MSDNGLKILVSKHSESLQELEMFGCFNITSRGIRHLASVCTNLRTLQLGQCYKLTDSCIAEVSSSLCCVQNLDLRGCKQIKDSCIEKIVANCSRLHTLALANCPNISNNAMQKIASTLPGIRSIDVCGCKLITDESVNRLATNCRQLVYLDISSTGCTYKSICRLAEQGSNDLETLKLNFITGITETSLTKLTNSCKRLTTLHLYGCKRVKNLEKIQALHPNLIIEADRD
ncbi:F-box/LRR-repeat protein 2-like [Octopus bimaculoides]|nr:F-box/LRR-repeat protein 2-like [Octopus bimaculoides]|eukprot:XP_014769248.1 PREDICTED: F-box/LRR-repeat protein 2-like [Octopus bimaculoides]